MADHRNRSARAGGAWRAHLTPAEAAVLAGIEQAQSVWQRGKQRRAAIIQAAKERMEGREEGR